ncbi:MULTISPECIES: FGGY-family carbohydrate kinase [Dictyoglomus]|jgi:xylulokinase|uniref:Carbohydrate kinase FGGY n=1 Tax=Dictyoglomus turgidum (strain DSM 6724 / Z-1310) TaxID=515635 RepID=B8E2L3_DICTD|nr:MULTISPECIES: FGGY-family carbohydrate kinase [Dictyoglomus]ACK42857.1 carbohydrate kinase FGGY [Dictyoglomus turgidum DSM 6724]HBU30919.1 sugar kinase [Dictyoglomus sp.]
MYITIDLGTTNIKIIIWSEEGKILKKESINTPIERDKTINPLRLINTIEEITEKFKRKYKNRITGISTGGMAESGLLIDKKGRPLTPVYTWLDHRGGEELKILKKLSRERIFEITGLKINPKYSLAKILWLKKHYKDLWRNSYKWLNVIDFINYHFTGKPITDYSLASRMLLFDIRNKKWSEEILNLCEIPMEKLPEVKPAGSIIEEKEQIYVLGGHDHPIGSLTLDLSKTLYDSWGTAEAILAHTKEPMLIESIKELGYSVGCIWNNLYYVIAGIPYSGGITKWTKEKLKLSFKVKTEKSSKILFFPYLMGKENRNSKIIKAFFYGIDLNTSLKDIGQAIWEGVFFETKTIIESLKKNFEIKKIIVSGGMTRYKSLLQLKANIINMPLHISKEKELTSKGLALLISKALNKELENFKEKSFLTIYSQNKEEFEKVYFEYKKIRDLLGL